jgi:hypothetical protein
MRDASVMTPAMAVLRRKTANNSHKIPLFFRAPNDQRPRISAEGEVSVADESLPQTSKTASPAADTDAARRRPATVSSG